MTMWMQFFQTLTRKKPLDDTGESRLAKVLTAFDLTSLGIGSTLGVGVYVIAGEVSKEYAGPAVIISFFIAALTSVFAGLCYAEFGARVPKAGSAYAYSYVTIGEFIAFIIGWNLILEYAIGSASVVKGLSTYLDSLTGHKMSEFFISIAPMDVVGLGKYPDFFAFIVTMIFSLGIAFGCKESTMVNNVFTLLNLTVVLFVIIAGLFKVNFSNWNIPQEQVPDEKYGTGGFAPYGISGIIKGAAVCFYGFIGFDCIATAGEEAKNPRKSIPFAVIASLGMVFLAYFGISAVITLMLPYYEQDKNAPLPYVFRQFGWTIAEYVVSIGAIFGLCASLMGSMFPLPRIVFAMSADGLLFKCLGDVSPKFHTPVKGTLITGFLCAVLASIFNLSQLISMMSIGTLLAYSMVASSVLILRYKSDGNMNNNGRKLCDRIKIGFFARLFNRNNSTTSTKKSEKIVVWSTTLYCVWCLLCSLVVTKFEDNYEETTSFDLVLLVVSAVPVLLTLYIISCQPISSTQIFFKVPLVPWLPGLSIFVNIFLMIKLDHMTWIRLAIWIAIGLVIYFSYGIRKSVERNRMKRASLTIIKMRHHSLPNVKSSIETPLILVNNS